MKQNLLKTCVPLSAVLLLSGCIDNKYDLSDIDKTTQINVNDLVIPVNVDAIELSDIIELDDDSKIKIVNVNGQEVYAVTQDGTFSSNEINVSAFTADKPVINPAYATFSLNAGDLTRAQVETFTYNLKESETQDVSFNASNVDKAVKKITALEFKPLNITMNMTASGINDNSTIELPKVTFNFLKGLVIPNLPSNYSYDDVNGVLEVTNLPYTDKATINITATGLDFTKADASLIDQQFIFDSGVNLRDGEMKLHVSYDSGTPAAADEITFELVTDVNQLDATYFSGEIEYNLEGDGLHIDPVSLSDLPDFLADEKTDLILANPQIYINLNNPVAGYRLGFETGLQLTSVRGDVRETFDPEDKVEVGYNHGVAGPYNFVISPVTPSDILEDYKENIKHVEFTSLSNVLAGDGLPESLEINLVNPMLPTQTVDRFELGSAIPGVEGKYEFLAPLALKNGSVIIYSTTEDGWADDDLDKMTIKSLTIDADATSTLPLGAQIFVHPLDKNGNSMTGVTVTPADLAAFSKDAHITVTISGDIHELDGVRIEAVVRPDAEDALAPTQTISLKNIGAKVSGFYLTDFE